MTFIVLSIAGAAAAVVAAVASVAAAVASVIGAVVGSFVATVAGTVLTVVSLVRDAIAPILATVGAIVGGVVTTLASVMGTVINAVGGVLEAISSGVKAAVEAVNKALMPTVKTITKYFRGFVTDVYEVIVEPFKPILIPIRDTLKTISDFITGTKAWIVTELKPVADLIGLVNDISALVTIKQLFSGQMEIAQILGDTSKESNAALAESIFVLYRDIVQTTTGTLEIVRNHYTRLRDTIDEFDERLRKDMDLAIGYAKETIQGEIDKVRDGLSERILPVELKVAQIQRRTEDLPFFQQMIIRSLE